MKTSRIPILLYLIFLIFGCSSPPDIVSTEKKGEKYSADEIRRMSVDQPFLLSGDYFREREQSEKVQDAVLKPQDAGQKTNVSWPHENSDLSPDPSVLFGKLPNGFRYAVMENSNPKNRISMHLYVNAGSLHEADNQKGLAHFMEHLSFNGSEHFAPGEMVKFFQKIGMQFGPDANAHTSFDRTVYDVLLPNNDAEIIREGMTVLKDYAHGALLIPSEIDRERKVILAEKRTRDSVSYRTHIATMAFEFPESRIPERFVIGDEKVIEAADQKIIKDYYDTWYRPENMILVMVGDTDRQLAEKLITEKFSDIAAKVPPRPFEGIGNFSHQGIKPFYHFEKEAGNTSVSIEVVRKKSPEPDSLSLQKRMITQNAASLIVQNRLDTLLRKSDAPFTSASVYAHTFLKEVEYAEIGAQGKPENWEKILAVLEQTLRQALIHGFTESELARVKKDMLAELDNAVKKAATRESGHLAYQIISDMNNHRVFQSPSQEKELFSPFIQSLSLKEVHDAFQKCWEPDHRLVMVSGNADLNTGNVKPEDHILAAFYKSRTVEVSEPENIVLKIFPYFSDPDTSGKIVRRTDLYDLGITQIDFENGLRLNLKKTDFKANEVVASLSFGKGRMTEPQHQPGLAELTTRIIQESGVGPLNRDELAQALAGKSTGVAFHVSENSFVLDGETIRDEIPLMFQLWYAYLKDTAFREDAYKLVMEQYRQQYLTLSRSPEGALRLHAVRFLAGGDSRFGLPSYEQMQKLSIADVQNWVSDSLKQDALELSIVGDFEIEPVIELAAKYLGTLQRKERKSPDSSRQPKFPNGQNLNLKIDSEIPKGVLFLSYPTDDMWNISRTRRLSILAEIFSDRLREIIRDKLGAAYSPDVYHSPSKTYPGYGMLKVLISIKPEDADMVAKEVRAIAADMAAKGISQDELQRAVDPMITNIKDMLRQNGYWLFTVLKDSKYHPEQLEWSRSILNDYAAITVEDMAEYAKRYLDNRKSAAIIVKPGK